MYAMPIVPAGAAALVKSGASTMMMEKFWVATGKVPLAAVIVPLKVPNALGVPVIAPPEPSVRPVGRLPAVTVNVIGVLPDAVQVWLYAMPTVPLDGGATLVKSGAWVMTIEKFCVALGSVPFIAVIVPLKVPVAPGVPEITPPEVSVRPVGRAPEVTVKVIGAVPDAAHVWL